MALCKYNVLNAGGGSYKQARRGGCGAGRAVPGENKTNQLMAGDIYCLSQSVNVVTRSIPSAAKRLLQKAGEKLAPAKVTENTEQLKFARPGSVD